MQEEAGGGQGLAFCIWYAICNLLAAAASDMPSDVTAR